MEEEEEKKFKPTVLEMLGIAYRFKQSLLEIYGWYLYLVKKRNDNVDKKLLLVIEKYLKEIEGVQISDLDANKRLTVLNMEASADLVNLNFYNYI